jgi:hypothetical protein
VSDPKAAASELGKSRPNGALDLDSTHLVTANLVSLSLFMQTANRDQIVCQRKPPSFAIRLLSPKTHPAMPTKFSKSVLEPYSYLSKCQKHAVIRFGVT